IDGWTLAFALALAVATGLVFGVGPALRSLRADLGIALRQGGRNGTTDRVGRRFLESLVVAEVGLALVLLIVTGLLLASMNRLRAVDPGFDPTHTLVFKLSLPPLRYPSDASQRLFVRELTSHLGDV